MAVAEKEAHKPYVPASTVLPEFTPRAVILGVLFGLIFGASTVYLGLKVGLTVSASIPIAVLSITILRAFGRASILENNIVQTTGSASESIAAGIVFTIPALLILGLDLNLVQTSIIAAAGGVLGILLMIPLRRSLIVKEHGNLPYPEGTACAEVLVVGDKGGSDAKTVFLGFGVGFVYKFLMTGLKFWREIPAKVLTGYQGARVAAEISPELLGVGFIIGPRVASYMFGGGIIAALVLIPTVKFFGAGLTTNIFPAAPGELIANMSASVVFDRYVRYMAAGAVAMGGIISLARSLPTIIQAFRAGLGDIRGGDTGFDRTVRTERDIPIIYAVVGVIALLLVVVLLPQIQVDWISAVMILVFGFFFVTVSSRICGQIGSTSNPISGMTIATLLFTSLIFLMLGRLGAEQRVIALTVGAIVCVAAANAGNTSQDLKTGYLVGATPARQQTALLIGAITSSLVIGLTLNWLNREAINLLPVNYPAFTAPANVVGEPWADTPHVQDGKTYRTARLSVETPAGDGKTIIPAGKYLVGDDGRLHYLVNPGVGGVKQGLTTNFSPDVQGKTFAPGSAGVKDAGQSRGMDDQMYTRVVANANARDYTLLVDAAGNPKYEVVELTNKLDAPKAALMGVLVDGVLTQKLPWTLIIIGALISVMLEIVGVSALPVAVGIYLPISTSATIFAGGLIRAIVAKLTQSGHTSLAEEETGKGVLLASGLIAGGAIGGLVASFGRALAGGEERLGFGSHWPTTEGNWSNFASLLIFAGLAAFLFVIAKRRTENQADR